MNTQDIQLPSNSRFGFFFSAVFALVAAYFGWNEQINPALAFGALSLLTVLVTTIKPDLLEPFNRLWMRIGLLLGKIVSPVVLGIIFFALFTPTGVVMRLAGRDELRLKHKERDSYWKDRMPVGPEPSSFKNQF